MHTRVTLIIDGRGMNHQGEVSRRLSHLNQLVQQGQWECDRFFILTNPLIDLLDPKNEPEDWAKDWVEDWVEDWSNATRWTIGIDLWIVVQQFPTPTFQQQSTLCLNHDDFLTLLNQIPTDVVAYVPAGAVVNTPPPQGHPISNSTEGVVTWETQDSPCHNTPSGFLMPWLPAVSLPLETAVEVPLAAIAWMASTPLIQVALSHLPNPDQWTLLTIAQVLENAHIPFYWATPSNAAMGIVWHSKPKSKPKDSYAKPSLESAPSSAEGQISGDLPSPILLSYSNPIYVHYPASLQTTPFPARHLSQPERPPDHPDCLVDHPMSAVPVPDRTDPD